MKKINLPTKITILRIVISTLLILAIIVFYLLDEYKVLLVNSYNLDFCGIKINLLMIIFWIVFLVASLTDFLDGYLARKNNEVTDLGKFLDPLADKMLINSIMIFLCFNFISISDELTFPWFCVVLMTIRDLIVDGLRFMAASKNVTIAANMWGKAKTVLQMIAISLVMLNGFPFSFIDYAWIKYLHITDFFCYLATIVSLIGGYVYLKDNRKVLE